MTLKLTWYADLKAESDLKRMAVTWEIVSIPFSKIDLKESRFNGARLTGAILHHKVDDYVQGMRNGDTFPRILVHKTPTGYVILSGNQRATSVEKLISAGDLPKSVEIEVYLVGTKDKLLLEVIARAGNVSHGEGPAKDERIAQAVGMVKANGLSFKDAAKYFMVSEKAIRDNAKAEEQRKQLHRAGMDTSRLSNAQVLPLSDLNYDEPAKIKLGTLIVQHNIPSERVKQVAGVLAKEKSSENRLHIIQELAKECSHAAHEANGKANKEQFTRLPDRPRRDKFLRYLASLANFLDTENGGEPFSTLEELQVSTKADKERVADLSKKVLYRLRLITK